AYAAGSMQLSPGNPLERLRGHARTCRRFSNLMQLCIARLEQSSGRTLAGQHRHPVQSGIAARRSASQQAAVAQAHQVEPDLDLVTAHRQLIPLRPRRAARSAVQHRNRYLTERLTGIRWQGQQPGFELLLEMTQGTFGSL